MVEAARRYWLVKSEPTAFAWDDLWRAPGRRTCWDGVRNFQARNLLRDEMMVDDGVLFYHSSADPMAVTGVARVVKAGYPDHTAFDPQDPHYDPDSDPGAPTWYMVDIAAVAPMREPLTRDRLKSVAALKDMMLLRRGARLSVQPVTAAQWKTILKLGGVEERW